MVAYDDVTQILGVITAMREPFDHHGERVASLATTLARACGLNDAEVEMIGVAAHLHDIGKLLIRPDLLNAPRKLTQDEQTEMQTHVTLGWAVVNEAQYPPSIQEAVRYHHERLDGSGYPDGLTGSQISDVARLVCICDVYAALTSPRPYRRAYSHNFAMAMIQKDKRTRFDPDMVDLFFETVARGSR
jgi:putative nucleotidyltransferase with HDIG domain